MSLEEQKASLEYLHEILGVIQTPKVLVVEDDPNDVELHLKLLSKFVCNVVVARTAESAIREIKEDGIDLILLDAKLPSSAQQSEEVVMTAAGLIPDASVIIVTGYPDSITKSSAIKKGAKLILEKPLTEKTLSAILHLKPNAPC